MSILSQEQVALLNKHDANSAYNAAYRTTFANIQFDWERTPTRQHMLLLTTPVAYSGQALAVANLAIAAAQSGTSTIVIDANLADPALHQHLGVANVAGLGNLLSSNDAITPQAIAAHLCKTFLPELRLLTAGTAALQGLGLQYTPALRDLIEATRDYLAQTERGTSLVLFTSPPVLSGMDATQVSSLVDQTFLTIVTGRTTRRQARQAQEQLERGHAQLSGIILVEK